MAGKLDRRGFLNRGAALAAGAGALARLSPPAAHAAGSDAIRVGLIGCGGRGTGAADQIMRTGKDVRLVALGDLFRDRVDTAFRALRETGGTNFAVSPDRCFAGIDAFRQVIDSGVDAVLLAAPPHFRPAHVEAAVAAGKHVFAEKPVGVDTPGVLRVQKACELARQKGLSVVSGLMLHYDPSMQQTIEQVHGGAIGSIVALQCNYNTGGLWVRTRETGWSDMEWQLRNWYYFTWLSGDHIVEQHVHCLDLMAWALKGEYPVRAVGSGGRQARTEPLYGQIFDHHAVCYEYASGPRCFSFCRQQEGTAYDISCLALGTRGTADLLKRSISGSQAWNYESASGNKVRSFWGGHQEEQQAFADSIRAGKPLNNGSYMCQSTLMAIMGRMATYTGQAVTWDQVLASREDLNPPSYDFGPYPVAPVAVPGQTKLVDALRRSSAELA